MSNSEILARVLTHLQQRKVGKRITRDFEQFVRNYEDAKRSFIATFPEYGPKKSLTQGEITDNLSLLFIYPQ
jgi:hypothetical protein